MVDGAVTARQRLVARRRDTHQQATDLRVCGLLLSALFDCVTCLESFMNIFN